VLANRIDVYPSTVSTWTTGKTKTPGAVIAYLELLATIKRLAA
jgi:DNA-binding transcriptional regulator YiaG